MNSLSANSLPKDSPLYTGRAVHPKAIAAIAIGTLIMLGGVFVLLGATQTLPHRANLLSVSPLGGKIGGGVAVGVGALVWGSGGYVQYKTKKPLKFTKISENVFRVDQMDWVFKPSTSTQTKQLQTECLLYELSETLGFNVVPETRFLPAESAEAQLLSPGQPLLLQRYVEPAPPETPLDINHAHKVIIFNWLTGRVNKAREASIIDIDGKVMDVDNRKVNATCPLGNILREIDAHWLCEDEEIRTTVLDDEIITWILSLPSIITLQKETLPEVFSERNVREVECTYSSNLVHVKRAIGLFNNHASIENLIDALV